LEEIYLVKFKLRKT